MVKNLKNTIELLKQRVHFNLSRIHENEVIIKEILKEPVSEARSQKLTKRFNVNKQMIKENNVALKLQKDLISYIENYHSELLRSPEIINTNIEKNQQINSGETKIEFKREDYFELTINHGIDFDNRHPYFNDEGFLNDLLSYFIGVEDYEMCARLTTIKKNKNQHAG